jgi:hypothetical protein
MKKLFFWSLIRVALPCAVLLAGCTSGEVPRWDFPNEEIIISLKNGRGDNLLSPRPGSDNAFLKGISVTYNGETHNLKGIPATRADKPVLPTMNGLQLRTGWNGSAVMVFGEFSCDEGKEYRGETFTINWADGTSDEVKFDLYATPNGEEQPSIHKRTWLNKDEKGEWIVSSENTLTVIIVK